MIGKIIAVILVLIMIFFSLIFVYQNVPREPVALKMGNVVPETIELIGYGAVPVFSERLRFNHNIISYFIEGECDGVRREAMVEAFALFANKMRIVSFYEVSADADINVGCSDNYISLGENLFAAGEGGPSIIINTSNFKTIEEGKISLYDDPRCDYPVVELHELGHVFGFDHSSDPNNIMYNTSNCNQRISGDMVKLINDLYSIEALADASLNNIKAVKRGKYMDFNITVLNDGMLEIDDIALTIVVDGEDVEVMELGEIGIGYGRTLRAENVKLPSMNVDKIKFVVDKDNVVRELNEENNVVEMVVSSQ